jgi:hypothetical protein
MRTHHKAGWLQFSPTTQVIAYMTLGVDTSSLFSVMVMACATREIVHKVCTISHTGGSTLQLA